MLGMGLRPGKYWYEHSHDFRLLYGLFVNEYYRNDLLELNRKAKLYTPLFERIEALVVIEAQNLQDVYR